MSYVYNNYNMYNFILQQINKTTYIETIFTTFKSVKH